MYNFIAIYRILSYLEQALDYDEPICRRFHQALWGCRPTDGLRSCGCWRMPDISRSSAIERG